MIAMILGGLIFPRTTRAELDLGKTFLVKSVDLKMMRIPAGTFPMGSPAGEAHRHADETPRQVTLSEDFYMGAYEVTQRQFYDLMLPDYDHDAWQYKRGPIHEGLAFAYRYPRHHQLITRAEALGGELSDRNPMECVSWERANEFCEKMTEKERAAKRLPPGYHYRLPSEAEWEYACRAGSKGPYNVKGNYSTLAGMNAFAFIRIFGTVHCSAVEVGEKRKPNAWGLYDMHGNVSEWCSDWYAPYAGEKVIDPRGPKEGTEKVARGGSFIAWSEKADIKRIGLPLDEAEDKMGAYVHPFLRSASRAAFPPETDFYGILGFRVVLAKEFHPVVGGEDTVAKGSTDRVAKSESQTP